MWRTAEMTVVTSRCRNSTLSKTKSLSLSIDSVLYSTDVPHMGDAPHEGNFLPAVCRLRGSFDAGHRTSPLVFLREKPDNQSLGSECGLRSRLDLAPLLAETNGGFFSFLRCSLYSLCYLHKHCCNVSRWSRRHLSIRYSKSQKCLIKRISADIQSRFCLPNLILFFQPSENSMDKSQGIGVIGEVISHFEEFIPHIYCAHWRVRITNYSVYRLGKTESLFQCVKFCPGFLGCSDHLAERFNQLLKPYNLKSPVISVANRDFDVRFRLLESVFVVIRSH